MRDGRAAHVWFEWNNLSQDFSCQNGIAGAKAPRRRTAHSAQPATDGNPALPQHLNLPSHETAADAMAQALADKCAWVPAVKTKHGPFRPVSGPSGVA